MKSKFHIVGSTADKVFLVDDNTDAMSVTNDAENVTEYVNRRQFKWRLATGGSSVKSVQILQEPTVKG
jgi:hypothetical protein